MKPRPPRSTETAIELAVFAEVLMDQYLASHSRESTDIARHKGTPGRLCRSRVARREENTSAYASFFMPWIIASISDEVSFLQSSATVKPLNFLSMKYWTCISSPSVSSSEPSATLSPP